MLNAARAVCIAACRVLGEAIEDTADEATILAAMKRRKGSIGAVLAQEFVAAHPYSCGWPKPLLKLTERLQKSLSNRRNNGETLA